MNIAYWIGAGLLGCFYLYAGAMKVLRSRDRLRPMMAWVDRPLSGRWGHSRQKRKPAKRGTGGDRRGSERRVGRVSLDGRHQPGAEAGVAAGGWAG